MPQAPQKVALVTGAARGIGLATAKKFLGEGWRVALLDIEGELLGRAVAEIGQDEATLALTCDVSDAAAVGAAMTTIERRFGRLDALVNNASTFYQTAIGEIGMEDWNDLIGANLQAPLFLSQAAAPALKKSQGAIVNITDIHAERPLKSYVVYSVAKAGLVGLTRSLARELAPDVRVNAVAPGPILWPDEEVFDELARQRIISHTPLKREGTPDDIAKAVQYLLSDAPYVTGETINVDGGRHIAL